MKYTFTLTEDGRVDVTEPGGALTCWLPAAVGGEIERAYNVISERDWVVANEWMAGVMLGAHCALAYANQMPEVLADIRSGLSFYQMGEPPWAVANGG